MSFPQTLGVVLAGGLARRMAGDDKWRLTVGGVSILDRVLRILRPHCDGLLINANDAPERFAATGLPVVADSVPDHPGPLAGILAGLNWAARNAAQIKWVVSAPSDCPFLPGDLVPRLHQARAATGTQLACAASGGRRHPVVALWPVALREDLRRALVDDGMRKVDDFSARHALAVAEWPTTPFDPFFNVNTPDDAAAAERLAALYPEA